MGTVENKGRRPFHETIIDAINRASVNELDRLAMLIKTTKIPKGHDEIIEAWTQRIQQAAMCGFRDDDRGVVADLLEQKQEAEEKAAKKEKAMKRILLIEDDEEIQKMWQDVFTNKGLPGIELIGAVSVQEAEEKFSANRLGIVAIVVDACVPGYFPNTPELVKKIRAAGFKGPMVAVSTRREFRWPLMEAGCDYMCNKEDLPGKLIEILSV